jgi:phosphate-selective porin OprO and OprP
MRTKFLRSIGTGVLVGSLIGPAVARAQDAAPDDPAARAATLQQLVATLKSSSPSTAEGAAEARAVLEALTERIAELDQQLRILERKLEIEREQATEKAKTAASVTVSGQQGYSLRSGDGNFQIRFRGYIQSDGRFVGDSDTTSGPSTFVLRRVRPVIEATAFKIFDFKLMPDFGGGTTVLQDAYADARFAPWFRIRVGKYKAPFGLSRLQSATEMTFIERGTPTLIAPNRDLGVMAFGDVLGERLTYQIGVFNGVVDGGSADIDDRSGKDVVARVFAHPFRKAQSDTWKQLGVGFAVSGGSQRGTFTTPDLPSYRTAAQQTFFRYRSDLTPEGTTVANGDHWRVGPQAYFYRGRVGLLTEYYVSNQKLRRGVITGDNTSKAWQLEGSYVLTGEDASYRGVTPQHTFERATGGKGWGAFELIGRYGRFEVDEDVFQVFANPAASARSVDDVVGGVNWYLNRMVKITAEFETNLFDGGAPDGGDRQTERGVFTRLQFAF